MATGRSTTPVRGAAKDAGRASSARVATPAPAVRSAPAAARPRPNVYGPLSIVVSLVALLLGFVPLVGFVCWPLAIVGAVLGIIGATRLMRRHAASIAGIAVGALALIVGLAVSVQGLGAVASLMAAPAVTAAVAGPAARITPTPAAKRVTDVTAPGVPSVKWILTDPAGTRYGGYPAQQRSVVGAIEQADAAFKRASGSAAKGSIIAARDAAVCRALPGGRFTDWVGSVHATGTDETGKASIEIHVAPTIVLQTWDNALSDQGLHTLVPRSSSFYRAITAVTPGTTVRFSGTLLPSPTSCLQQENLTADMYGLDPNFIVRLSALTAR